MRCDGSWTWDLMILSSALYPFSHRLSWWKLHIFWSSFLDTFVKLKKLHPRCSLWLQTDITLKSVCLRRTCNFLNSHPFLKISFIFYFSYLDDSNKLSKGIGKFGRDTQTSTTNDHPNLKRRPNTEDSNRPSKQESHSKRRVLTPMSRTKKYTNPKFLKPKKTRKKCEI